MLLIYTNGWTGEDEALNLTCNESFGPRLACQERFPSTSGACSYDDGDTRFEKF